jgi:hypothetical protein
MPSYLEASAEIARAAGAVLSQYFDRNIGFEYKGAHDLITAADKASEALIVERLRSYFPNHSIVGEESGCHKGSSDLRWYVDPLDGTTPLTAFQPRHAGAGASRRADLRRRPTPSARKCTPPSVARGHLNNRRIHVSGAARSKRVSCHRVSIEAPPRRQPALLSPGSHGFDGVRRAARRRSIWPTWPAAGLRVHPLTLGHGCRRPPDSRGRRWSRTPGEPHTLQSPHVLATNGAIHDHTDVIR